MIFVIFLKNLLHGQSEDILKYDRIFGVFELLLDDINIELILGIIILDLK